MFCVENIISSVKSFNDLLIYLFTVSYLTYGPFSSYAPIYDSTTANLSKEESDLLLSTYGDDMGMQYSKRYVGKNLVHSLCRAYFYYSFINSHLILDL